MKLNKREKKLLVILKENAGREIDLDTIIERMPEPKKKKNVRKNFLTFILLFRKKIEARRIFMRRVSPIGAGHKAIYFVPEKICTISGE